MMSSTARWSFKSLAFLAIIHCSAQEYEASSTTNDLLLPVPNSGVKVSHASTDAFVCAWVRR